VNRELVRWVTFAALCLAVIVFWLTVGGIYDWFKFH